MDRDIKRPIISLFVFLFIFLFSLTLTVAQSIGPQLLWSNATLISNSNATEDAMSPSIATDLQGNIHIIWNQKLYPYVGEVFYTKLDSFGNTVVSNRQLTNFSGIPGLRSSIAVDNFDNVHIVWAYDQIGSSINGIRYTRLDRNGTIVVNGVFLPGAPGTEIAVDSQGNLLVAGRGDEVHYKKFDNMGNALTQLIQISASLPEWEPWDLKILADSNDVTHILWMEKNITRSQNQVTRIKYSAVNNKGNIIVDNLRLDVGMNISDNIAIAIDKDNNVLFSWDSNFNGGNVYLSKRSSNGLFILDRMPISKNNLGGNLALNIDPLNHINILGQGWFTQLDARGNVIINLMSIGISQNVHIEGIVDRQGNNHLVWFDGLRPRQIKYQKSLNPATLVMQGIPKVGFPVKFILQDIYNLNGNYLFGLSTNISQGITLPDGRKFPLDDNGLLQGSFYTPKAIGLSNSSGLLNSNNQATVSFDIPNIPSLSGLNLYASFITLNSTGTVISISDPVAFTIV